MGGNHAASDLEGQSCSSQWTDCNGCHSTGGFCGTPSGAQGEPGGHSAVVVCGQENCPTNSGGASDSDCHSCATQFADAGGCAASDPSSHIPSGCGHCGNEAMQECQNRGHSVGGGSNSGGAGDSDCHSCATQFADAGGCTASDPSSHVPSGCGHCGNEAMQECQNRG